MSLPCRTQVDDSILNFTPIIEMVCFGTFNVTLPITFMMPKDKEDPSPKAGSGGNKRQADKKDDNDGQPKKRGRTLGREGNRVKNDSPPDSCKMKEGETWATHFANKGLQDRVDWNSTCKMCPRWHIRGFCFADCVNKESHVGSGEIPAEKITKFKEFMQKCRST